MRVTIRGEGIEVRGTWPVQHIRDLADVMQEFNALVVASPSEDRTVWFPVRMPDESDLSLAARHVLYHLEGDHEDGLEPGGFIASLIECMLRADPGNFTLLSQAFPAYTTVVSLYKNQPYGVDAIRGWANKTPDTNTGAGSSPKEEKEVNNG